MSEYVVIRDMSAGNESIGEMWQETKVFKSDATLHEVMKWAEGREFEGEVSRKNIKITRAHQEKQNDN